MNIPNLPDSLHKTLVIAGVILIVSSSYFVYQNNSQINKNAQELILEKELLNHEFEIIQYTGYLSKTDSLRINQKQTLWAKKNDIHNKDTVEKALESDVVLQVSFLLGFALIFYGIIQWKITENIHNDILYCELFEKGKVYKECQSCGIDMQSFNIRRGSEANGDPSKLYCYACYDNGAYTEPNITQREMKVRIQRAKKRWLFLFRHCSKKKLNKLQRWSIPYKI